MKRLLTILSLCAILLISYNTTFADSPRMVVIEQFTSTYCGPCATYNPAFHAYIGENMDKIIPIVYHGVYNKTGDPMWNHNGPMVDNRASYYGVTGVPHAVVGGNDWKGNPGNLQLAQNAVAKANAETSKYDMDIEWTRDGDDCMATITINASESSSDYTLHVVINEYLILNIDLDGKEAAPNGEKEFKWVPRKMLPNANGEVVEIVAGTELVIKHEFKWHSAWKEGNVYVNAFLQDKRTKRVEQGCSALKMANSSITIAEENMYSSVGRNAEVTKTITITNPNDFACDMNLTAAGSNNWTYAIAPATVALEAGASSEVTLTLNTNEAAAYAFATINVTPSNVPQGYLLSPSAGSLYFITEDAKYATLTTTTDKLEYLTTAMNSLDSEYSSNWIVADANVIAEKFSDMNFDIAYVLIGAGDFMAFGVDGILEGYVNKRIEAGLNTIVTSNLGLYIASGDLAQYGYIASAGLKTLYNEHLGIKLGKNVRLVNDQNQLLPMAITGVAGETMGANVNLNINTTNGYYTAYIDAIAINDGANAKPFLSYDNTVPANNYAGVYAEEGKAKTVYMGFCVEASANGGNVLMNNIMTWFAGGSDVKDNSTMTLSVTPNPVVSNATIDYTVTGATANVNIKLIDVTGATVSELVNQTIPQGEHFVNMNASELSTGMYYIISNINGTITTTPVVIKK